MGQPDRELVQPAIESIRDHAAPGMSLQEVLAVLDALASSDCRVWVAGGWGVDALFGRQTRAHRDLDLAVDARHMATAIQILEGRGYSVETDWWPVRIELAAAGKGWVNSILSSSTPPDTDVRPIAMADPSTTP
jgi:Aminoglycoside-2''-adenylyltransferase